MIDRVIKFLLWLIAGIIGLVVVIVAFAPVEPPDPCVSDWRKCAVNSDIVNSYHGITSARVDCRLQAEKLARFGDPQWPTMPFSAYMPGTDGPKTGRITLVEPNARFQNGFGAMAHTRVACEYDLGERRVISIQSSIN